MISGNLLLLSFVSGIFATFNPCGFAMLPGYLSISILGATRGRSRGTIIYGALRFSILMGAGVVAVFGLFALIVFPFSTAFQKYLPFVTILLGGAIFAIGIAVIRGKSLARLGLWNPRTAPSQKPFTLIGYGVTFALGSISCTIGPFIAATSAAVATTSFSGILFTYVAFGLGISLTIAALALITATSNQLLLKRIRNATHTIELVSGFLLVLVGLYLVYFGWYEISLQGDGALSNPFMDGIFQIQGSIVSAVSNFLDFVHIL